MLITLLYVTSVFPFGSACRWPVADVLFIIDGTVNLNVYEQLNELDFIRKTFRSMSISASKVHVAVAQYTPKAKVEFNLDSSQSNAEAESRLQSLSYSPCDPFSKTVPCTPIATLNSLAKQALLPGNRKTVPDVIILLGSSKYNLPHVVRKCQTQFIQAQGSTEVLFSPLSPIHTYEISVGGPVPSSETFEAAATSIRMHAVDFNSLTNLADPLCESVSSFVGDMNTSGFGSVCWLVTGILILLFIISLLVAAYAIYSYRNQALSYQKRVAEAERTLRRQNEYFTAKIHEQMEEHIATSKKHADDIRKQQETLQVQQLELQKHITSSGTPVVSSNQSGQQPIFIPVYTTKDDNGEEHVHVKDQPKTNAQPTGNDNTIHLTIDGKEIEVSNGKISTRFLGDDHRQTVQFQNNANGGTNHGYETNRGDGHPGHNLHRDRDHNGRGGERHRTDRDGEGHYNGNGGNNTGRERLTSEELNSEGIKVDESESDRERRHRREPTTSCRPKHNVARLNLNKSREDASRHPNWNSTDSSEYTETTDDTVDASSPPPIVGSLSANHPARALPPVDILFLVDSSSSIGITNFDAMKENVCKLLDDVDIAAGRSRVALIQYAQEPSVVFGFDKYYSITKGVQRMSYTGGATMLAKALSFAAGVLYNEQNMKEAKKKHKLMPTPRHDRLQILCVASDGGSDDNLEKATNYIHEKLQIKVLGMVSKSFNKEKLLPVTRFDGSVFVMTQTESMSIWIWRQQKLWAENYSFFLEKSRTKVK